MWSSILLAQATTWPDVALAAINVIQVVLLAWIGGEQAASRRERHRRQVEEAAGQEKPS